MSLPDIMKKNRDKLFKYGQSFQRTFHTPLNNFIDPVLGFDIVKFNEWLNIPDGFSTKDFLSKEYSENVCKMIEGLI